VAFQDWLEQDLLPTLNREGMYIPEEKREELKAALEKIKVLEAQVAQKQPKALPAITVPFDDFKAQIIGRVWVKLTTMPMADVAEIFAMVERKAVGRLAAHHQP